MGQTKVGQTKGGKVGTIGFGPPKFGPPPMGTPVKHHSYKQDNIFFGPFRTMADLLWLLFLIKSVETFNIFESKRCLWMSSLPDVQSH